jgi:hypothetical protein
MSQPASIGSGGRALNRTREDAVSGRSKLLISTSNDAHTACTRVPTGLATDTVDAYSRDSSGGTDHCQASADAVVLRAMELVQRRLGGVVLQREGMDTRKAPSRRHKLHAGPKVLTTAHIVKRLDRNLFGTRCLSLQRSCLSVEHWGLGASQP